MCITIYFFIQSSTVLGFAIKVILNIIISKFLNKIYLPRQRVTVRLRVR